MPEVPTNFKKKDFKMSENYGHSVLSFEHSGNESPNEDVANFNNDLPPEFCEQTSESLFNNDHMFEPGFDQGSMSVYEGSCNEMQQPGIDLAQMFEPGNDFDFIAAPEPVYQASSYEMSPPRNEFDQMFEPGDHLDFVAGPESVYQASSNEISQPGVDLDQMFEPGDDLNYVAEPESVYQASSSEQSQPGFDQDYVSGPRFDLAHVSESESVYEASSNEMSEQVGPTHVDNESDLSSLMWQRVGSLQKELLEEQNGPPATNLWRSMTREEKRENALMAVEDTLEDQLESWVEVRY